MFYFDNFYGKKILKSDLIQDITAFFTTRDGFEPKYLNADRVLTPIQTHSDNIEFIDTRNDYPETDGLIFTKKGEAGYLRFADCTPLIFYNPKMKIAAISHAGWRGTASQIAVKTIKKMGDKPDNIIAVIGPAICMSCYEVSEDVRIKLLSTVNNKEGLYKGNFINLKAINARQLEEAGVKQIDICPYCTSCNNDLFYSYRKENGTTLRHYAVITL